MLRLSLFVLLPLVCAASVHAADAVLIEGAKVKVTETDVLADAQRMPPESRKVFLSKPESVVQLGSNLLIRRALAAKAEADGLVADPVLEANLKIARDRVLSEAWLARLDEASAPSEAQQDAQALTIYRANPKRFDVPEQVRVRHVLVAKGDGARERADRLLSELRQPDADFVAIAKAQSADPSSAPKGGDLGFFARGRMMESFENAAFALQKPGEISGLVETDFGIHIIQLVEKRAAATKTFEEVRDALRREVVAQAIKDGRARVHRQIMEELHINESAVAAFSKQQQ